jgi:hypothetical protein
MMSKFTGARVGGRASFTFPGKKGDSVEITPVTYIGDIAGDPQTRKRDLQDQNAEVENYKAGMPAWNDAVKKVEEHIADATARGATIVTGGRIACGGAGFDAPPDGGSPCASEPLAQRASTSPQPLP